MKKIYLTIASLIAMFSMGYGQSLDVEYLSTYRTNVFDEGAAEIVVHDSVNQRLLFTNADDNSVELIDFSDPANLTSFSTIDMSQYGGGVNSVATFDGYFVVAVEADNKQENGSVVFFDGSGNFIAQIEAGALPDMVTFTPDGSKVIAANEGEPDDDYTADPDGSITIIDISGGINSVSQSNATTVSMRSFTGTLDSDVRIFGPDTSNLFFDDFETDSLDNVTVYDVYSDVSYIWDNYNGDNFVEINGFSGDTFSLDWLILPKMNLSAYNDAFFSFENTRSFSGGSLDLMISTDYDGSGNPESFTWDTITSQAVWSPGNYTDTTSGDISLSNYLEDDVYIGFRYTAEPGPGNATLWQLDNFHVKAPLDFANNLEPEYVTVSDNSETAFVILQENNALAIVDLTNNTIDNIIPLGFKDHSQSGNGLDASDDDGMINITTRPVMGMYQPDAIKYINVNGTGYIISANEGDARDYDAYSEEERIKDITLDPSAFPNATTLQEDTALGRLNITLSMGDTDNDGDYDELYSYGGRSFSVWNASTGALEFDSGDEFEQTIASEDPDNFNSNNDENDSFESRSDNKGPEPEAAEVAYIQGTPYAMIGLERQGGVMIYDMSNPTSPSLVKYFNNRDFSVMDVENGGVTNDSVGDLGIEDIEYIDASKSPDGKFYIVTSNEISGTVSVFEITGLSTGSEELKENSKWSVYPNPSRDLIRSNRVENYEIFDLSGRLVKVYSNTNVLNISDLNKGTYILKNEADQFKKIVKL
ncbi:choice-of-anchor I family protein [Salibacter halophilus]|nr:choice-of-anchor I family protein [Salibacter halophilus]